MTTMTLSRVAETKVKEIVTIIYFYYDYYVLFPCTIDKNEVCDLFARKLSGREWQRLEEKVLNEQINKEKYC